MTCRHRNTVREAFLICGTWGEFLRCRRCKEVVPMGPANDTADACLEMTAAMAATSEPDHGRYLLAISMHMCLLGWPGLASMEERVEWADDCEHLALAIWNHEGARPARCAISEGSCKAADCADHGWLP